MDTGNATAGISGSFGGMNRRDFLKMSGAGLAGASVLGAAGCGGGGGGAQKANDGSTVVTFSMAKDDSGTLQKMIDKFNKDNKGKYKVNHRTMPTDTGAYFDQLRTQFQAGGGDIDLIGGDVIWPAQFAANGWIIDLSDRFTKKMRSDFLQGPVDSNTYNGKVYGVPWYTDAGMLYYRKDLLQKSGFSQPPGTWDELISMAQKVKQDTGTKYGFVFQGAAYEGGVVDGIEYINSYGGSVLSQGDSNKVVIDSPESIQGLSEERKMVTSGVSPQAVSTYTEEETQAAFLNGDAVFARNWPYMYALTGDKKSSSISQDNVGVAPLPKGTNGKSVSGLGGWNFYINSASDSKTQDAAWEFTKFMVEPKQQKYHAMNGSFLPILSALYDDQQILDAVPVIKLGGEALKRTVPRPVSPYYSDMSLDMQDAFNASLKGSKSPKQAISGLQKSLQDIVDQGSQG